MGPRLRIFLSSIFLFRHSCGPVVRNLLLKQLNPHRREQEPDRVGNGEDPKEEPHQSDVPRDAISRVMVVLMFDFGRSVFWFRHACDSSSLFLTVQLLIDFEHPMLGLFDVVEHAVHRRPNQQAEETQTRE